MADLDLDLEAIAKGAGAIKSAIDAFKGAIGLLREAKDALPSSKNTEAVSKALDEAEKAAKIAEAELARAFGYQLCLHHFPPEVMIQTGYTRHGQAEFTCNACGAKYPPNVPPLKRQIKGIV
jgi:hypothetical protein